MFISEFYIEEILSEYVVAVGPQAKRMYKALRARTAAKYGGKNIVKAKPAHVKPGEPAGTLTAKGKPVKMIKQAKLDQKKAEELLKSRRPEFKKKVA